MSGSKGLSEQAQRIACECHNLDVLHLQNAPEYCDNADPNGCGGRFNKEDCEIYQSAHRIDAALRRAKAEGLGEAVRLCTILENHYAERSAGNRVAEIQRLAVVGVRNSILDRMDELDARAAQIEEVE